MQLKLSHPLPRTDAKDDGSVPPRFSPRGHRCTGLADDELSMPSDQHPSPGPRANPMLASSLCSPPSLPLHLARGATSNQARFTHSPTSSQEGDRVVEVLTESDRAGRCSKRGPMHSTQARASLATGLDEVGNIAGKAPKAGDIVAQHESLDIEAQESKRLCTVPEGLKVFPVYRVFMVATAVISLVLTGYYGSRSSK